MGGALMCGPTAPAPGASGTLVYLDCSPSLDAARTVAAGGQIAHVQDIDGNRIGLHAIE